MKYYSIQRIKKDDYRITDRQDNRLASCVNQGHAEFICAALNGFYCDENRIVYTDPDTFEIIHGPGVK